ncbi:hypothetical protein BRADI_2g60770v3 [Brachypodium distachyon]|uniref:Uncharacterized protein n=1 Tax=Brachypodium distachyon TaxID=15368 RepID=I1HV76_BRADI|nr:hypothetical protein BRADI_2g60770v3 [Brachypodium distachyon]
MGRGWRGLLPILPLLGFVAAAAAAASEGDADPVYRSIRGWEFVYVGAIKVKSELPSSLLAYRSQQHRWSCGPALLFKKTALQILSAKVPLHGAADGRVSAGVGVLRLHVRAWLLFLPLCAAAGHHVSSDWVSTPGHQLGNFPASSTSLLAMKLPWASLVDRQL